MREQGRGNGETETEAPAKSKPDGERSAAAEAGSAAPASRLLSLQRAAGNAAVAAMLAGRTRRANHLPHPPAASPPHEPTVQRHAATIDDEEHATEAAEGVYDALNWMNDTDDLRAALRDHSAALQAKVRVKFYAHGEGSIQDYLDDQLGGDDLVEAAALLDGQRLDAPHVSMAKGLIGLGTRDADVKRLLQERPTLDARKALERAYDRTFSWVGEGSLKKDLIEDLSGDDLQRALALLDRDLTKADELYLLTVGISGTKEDSAVKIIQDAWDQGPAAVRQLEADWDTYVWSASPKEEQARGWTRMKLRTAMEDEMGGEPLALVRAVFRGADEAAGLAPSGGAGGAPGSPDDRDALYRIRLRVAQDTLDAAADGAGTNEDQVYRAVKEIQEVWKLRIDLARENGGTAAAAPLEREWEQKRAALVRWLPEEMDSGGSENLKARLLLSGTLSLADEAWLADQDADTPAVLAKVEKAWQTGKMADFLADAARAKTDGGDTLRPAFDPLFLVPITSGTPWKRLHALVDTRRSDAQRGAERLQVEFAEGNDDSDLKRAHALLKDATDELRAATVTAYVDRYLGSEPGETATKKFLSYVNGRYSDAYTRWDLADLLDPTGDAAEMLRRAEGRLEDTDTWLVSIADTVTGEYSVEAAQESLGRLRVTADAAGATAGELQAMAAMAGVPLAGLAQFEYQGFTARLEEVRSTHRAISEAIATAVEVLVGIAITVATAGTGAPALLATLGSAIAGMATRELLMSSEHDFFSEQNAQKIIEAIATAGMQKFGAGLIGDILPPERVRALGRTGTLIEDAVKEGFGQVGSLTAAGMFAERAPTAEEIAAKAIDIAGGFAAGRTAGRINADVAYLPRAQQLRANVAASVSEGLMNSVVSEISATAKGNSGDLTGPELLQRIAENAGKAVVNGVAKGAGTTTAAAVAERRAQPRSVEEALLRDHSQRQYNMAEDPGPLAEIDQGMAGTFAGGRYDVVVLDKDTVLHRVGQAGGMRDPRKGLGQYFTAEPLASAAQGHIDLAIKRDWIDPATGARTGTSPLESSYAVSIPAGTTVYVGQAGTQSGVSVGGGIQIAVKAPWTVGAQVVRETPLR